MIAHSQGDWKPAALVVAGLVVFSAIGMAEEKKETKPAPRTPDRTEIWVPSEDFDRAMKDRPNAVLLSPAQYEALVRDAGRMKPDAKLTEPPVNAVVESMTFSGVVEKSASVARLEGGLVVRALAKGWCFTGITLPWRSLDSVGADGGAMAEFMADKPVKVEAGKKIAAPAEPELKLLARGPGTHHVKLRITVPITRGAALEERILSWARTAAPALLELKLPSGSSLVRSPPHSGSSESIRIALNQPGPAGGYDLAWREPVSAAGAARVIGGQMDADYVIGESEIQATCRVATLPGAGAAPAREFRYTLAPAQATVVAVDGSLLESWEQKGAVLTVRTTEPVAAPMFAVGLRLAAVLPEKDNATVPLPAVRPQGAAYTTATARVAAEEGVELIEIQGAQTLAASIAKWNASEDAFARVRKAAPRVIVDADCIVRAGKDSVQITRRLNVASNRALRELAVTLPGGEELLGASRMSGPALEWKQVGSRIDLSWAEPLAGSSQAKVEIQSRKRITTALAGAGAAESFEISNAQVPEAGRLAGYVALDHDPAWRVSLQQTGGLEDRDVRLAPVKGKMAWFALRDFTLGFELQRRDSVVDVEVAAFALPRARTIEIEGQIGLQISGAPLRQVSVKVTPELAQHVRFISPLVAEQKLDEATGTWSLTLAREVMGPQVLRFRMSQPAAGEAEATAFRATLPRFELSAARRFRGAWVVEANTDTQLAFETEAMQPIDVIRAPRVRDYEPRHRLVAGYTYGAGESSLTVTAERHAHSELAALVVNRLDMTSVLSQDGSSRHEAKLNLSHTGEQFVQVRLPEGSRLLSVVVADEAVKPVRAEGGVIAVPLPAGSADQASVSARIVFEREGAKWGGAGSRALEPVAVIGGAPILSTDWNVYVPEGYSYRKVETSLEQEGIEDVPGIVSILNPFSENGTIGDDEAANAFGFGSKPASAMQQGPVSSFALEAEADIRRERMLSETDERSPRIPPLPSNPIAEKMNHIILPQVTFSGASVEEAVEFLRLKSRDLDTSESDPAKRGVNFILRQGDTPISDLITLDLRDVPLSEALRYITELAGMKYKVEPHAVVIVPKSEAATEQYVRRYKVPADFLSIVGGDAAMPAADPFAAAPNEATGRAGDRTAQEVLKGIGIAFPEGASAVLNPVTSELIVKNTEGNLDLVDAYTGSLLTWAPPQAAKSGLLPLELELPTAGGVLRFHGAQAPEILELSFISWQRQMAWACLWMIIGGAVFLAWGRRRPLLRTVLAVLLLSLGALLLTPDHLPLANAALFGWLAALACWLVWRLLAWLERKVEIRRGELAVPVPVVLVGVLAWGFSNGSARGESPPPPPPDPAAHTVIVPYNHKLPPDRQNPQRYYLDRETFERLWNLARENRKPEPEDDANAKPGAAIQAALYRAAVEDERLVIAARYEVVSSGRWAQLDMTFASQVKGGLLMASDWLVDGRPSAVKDGKLILETPGRHAVDVTLEMRQPRGWKQAKIKAPRAAGASLLLTVPATDGRPAVEPGMLLTEQGKGADRTYAATLGQGEMIDIRRNPRRPLLESPPAQAEVETAVAINGLIEPVTYLATISFDFPGASARRFEFSLESAFAPGGWSVEGPDGNAAPLSKWSQQVNAGRRSIQLELEQPVSDRAKVRVWGSWIAAEGSLALPRIVPAAQRWETVYAIAYDATVRLSHAPGMERFRIARPSRLQAGLTPPPGGGALYFRLPSSATLACNIQRAPEGFEATADYAFQLAPQKMETLAALTLKRKYGAWTQASIGLPAEFEIQSVTGPGLASWKQEQENLYLQWQSGLAITEARLVVHLARSAAAAQDGWALEPLRLDGFEKIEGMAVIVAELPIEARLDGFTPTPSLKETDPDRVDTQFEFTPPLERKRALAFEGGGWSVRVALKRLEAKFAADGVALAQATDAGLLISQQVTFYVEQGALNRVTVSLPAALPEARVTGEALREAQSRVNGDTREYDCSFQGDILTKTSLVFDFELPLADEAALPFMDVAGASRLRRFFVLDNSSSRQSRVLEAAGVETCPRESLPFLPAVSTQPTYYRGTGSPGALRIGYEQLQASGGTAAIVNLAELTTVWRADGERWDEASYSLFNRSLQFLPIVLPNGADLIAVTVSGQPVRADEQTLPDGRRARLIPLIQTRAGERSLQVRLVYRIPGKGEPLSSGDELKMNDPDLPGITIERTVWTTHVPRRFKVSDSDGNMEEVAEEGKKLEIVEGMLAELGRINRALSSRGLTGKEGESASKYAEEAMSIVISSLKSADDDNQRKTASIEDSRRSKALFDFDGDLEKDQKLQYDVAQKLGKAKEELAEQQIVLTENRIQLEKTRNDRESTALGRQALPGQMQGWVANGAAMLPTQQTPEAWNLAQVQSTPAAPKETPVPINDNIVLNNSFFSAPAQQLQAGERIDLNGSAAGVAAGLSGSQYGYTQDKTPMLGDMPVIGRLFQSVDEFKQQVGKLNEPGAAGGQVEALIANNARANVYNNMDGAINLSGGMQSQAGAIRGTRMGGFGTVVPDSIDGLLAPVPSAPPVAMRSDPFAAPAAEKPVDAQIMAAKDSGTMTAAAAAEYKGKDAEVEFLGIEVQAANQLRASGRHSLSIDLPKEGAAYHFRKLKENAVLELTISEAWSAEKKSRASVFVVGLLLWAGASYWAQRRSRRKVRAA